MARAVRKFISELARVHAKEVSSSPREWMGYLDMSGRLYRYPFRDSFLIHAQRPDAVACTSLENWNSGMNRWVNRGAKGIALFDDRNFSGVRYVFDVSDTHPTRKGREVTLWTVDAKVTDRLKDYLCETYDVQDEGSMDGVLWEIAEKESSRMAEGALSVLFSRLEGTELAAMEENHVRELFCSLLKNSVYYTLHVRCGISPFSAVSEKDMDAITSFADLKTLAVLGATTNRIVEPILAEIGQKVRDLHREDRQAAIQQKNEKEEMTSKGVRDNGTTTAKENDQIAVEQDGEIRNAPGDLPEGEQAGAIRQPAAYGRSGGAPFADRARDTEDGDGVSDRSAGELSATAETEESSSVDGAHEQPEGDGRGDGFSGDRVPIESEAEEGISIYEEQAAMLGAFYGGLSEEIADIVFSEEEQDALEEEFPENVFAVAAMLSDGAYRDNLAERMDAVAEFYADNPELFADGEYTPAVIAEELKRGTEAEAVEETVSKPSIKAEAEEKAERITDHQNEGKMPKAAGIAADRAVPLLPSEEAQPAPSGQLDLASFSTPQPIVHRRRIDFYITDRELGYGSPKQKYKANVAAIRLLKQIEAEGRMATAEEQEVLSCYVGWGGIPHAFDPKHAEWQEEFAELKGLLSDEEYKAARASTVTAFYTPPVVAEAMYEVLGRLGFTGGNVLEPGCGIGNFMGMLPENLSDVRMFGVEKDSISARIAVQLYQNHTILHQGFEQAAYPENFFDVVIGNVPYAEVPVADKKYEKQELVLHDYFIAKSLDLLRPGGVVAVITSTGTLDKKDSTFRRMMAEKAELLGAIRLPNNTFQKNANTQVVADILFLQKRDRAMLEEPEWVQLAETPEGFTVNAYFATHPEMVLGEMREDTAQYGRKIIGVFPHKDKDFAKELLEAAGRIKGHIPEAVIDDEQEAGLAMIPAEAGVANFSHTIKDGKIYYRENSRMRELALPKTTAERVTGMIAIRDATRALLAAQMGEADDEEIRALQEKLNIKYDAFTAKYGLLNSVANSRAFSQDDGYYLLASLEHLDAEGNLERKADIFTKRTIQKAQPVTSVETADEALAVSISEKAGVDLPFMAGLSHKSQEELVEELSGVIFKNPLTEKYENADEYLSGYVREKLRLAERLAKADPSYQVNVEALKRVQPRPLEATEISVRLGATWIKTDYITQFMAETFQTPPSLIDDRVIRVLYSQKTGEWSITAKSADAGNVLANEKYGTKRINGYRLLQMTLNLKDAEVYDEVEDMEGKTRRVKNAKETVLAQQKQELLKDAFKEWVFTDLARREDLCKTYNEKFNNYRPRQYSGAHIRFAGMSPEISLMEHQRNAIAHALYGGNTLFAHCVGAGKTFEMVATAMESKRLGLCKKSLFVVPNHLTEQWGAEYLRLYPAANILVATKRDFEPARRKTFCSRIATGDYDAVIIGQSQFERIPLSPERQAKQIQEEIDEIDMAIEEARMSNSDSMYFTVKEFEKAKDKLEARLQKLYDATDKDKVVTFEELGVDRLFIDESHYYKNLFIYTKMSNIAGISTTNAKKSSDLFAKCRYMDEITGGKGVVFATGTPVSNSMVELYSIMRYLMPETLEKMELNLFDSWASVFGETIASVELAPEGTGYRTKTRFARFYNLPELMALFKECADIKTEDMLALPVPKAERITVVAKPSEEQKAYVESLAKRAEVVRSGGIDATEDNMLKITNDGRKCALDMRIVDEACRDFAGSKVNLCADNVYGIWLSTKKQRSAQLIFSDFSTPKKDGAFNVYDELREKLNAKGIPWEEIAFIHEYNTEKQKSLLFANVRAGKVRVLIGSTQKLGVGTNIQERLIALHHLDCPWRPNDLAQRTGRILRQGNKNETVGVFSYVTEGTFDSYLWQLVENKQKFIAQIMTSRSPARTCEDVDDTALSYAEIKALASGNPEIREKMELDVEVAKLKVLKSNYLDTKYRLEKDVKDTYPQRIQAAEVHVKNCEADIPSANALLAKGKEDFAMEILGVKYDARTEAGSALIAACMALKGENGSTKIGKYGDFELWGAYLFFGVSEDAAGIPCTVTLVKNERHTIALGNDPGGNITRINNALKGIEKDAEQTKERIAGIRRQFEAAKAQMDKPFEKEEELAAKMKRLSELNVKLNIEGSSTPNEAEGQEVKEEQEKTIPVADDEGKDQPERKASILKAIRVKPFPSGGRQEAVRNDPVRQSRNASVSI